MYESDSIREGMQLSSLFTYCAQASLSPVEMRVPGLSVYGARLLEAAGLTFDQVDATLQNARDAGMAWRVSEPHAISSLNISHHSVDNFKMKYFLLAPGKVDRATFEEWLPAPGAAGCAKVRHSQPPPVGGWWQCVSQLARYAVVAAHLLACILARSPRAPCVVAPACQV